MIARFAVLGLTWLAGVALFSRGMFALGRGTATRVNLAYLILGSLLLIIVAVAGMQS